MTTTESTSDIATFTIPCSKCHRWNRVNASRAGAGAKCGACKSPIYLDRPLHLDDSTFDRVVSANTVPVLIDFYADWCAPCKMMAPAVDELARTTAGTALIAKLDTEAAPQTAQRFHIRGIPTVIVFSGGHEAKRQSGAIPLGALRAMIAQ